jgi:hypothetical protein
MSPPDFGGLITLIPFGQLLITDYSLLIRLSARFFQ